MIRRGRSTLRPLVPSARDATGCRDHLHLPCSIRAARCASRARACAIRTALSAECAAGRPGRRSRLARRLLIVRTGTGTPPRNRVVNCMLGTAKTFSWIAACLLLAAACGSGRTAEEKQVRVQASAGTELQGENGLSAGIITQSCLGFDAMSVSDGSETVDAVEDISVSTASCGDILNGLPPNQLGLNGLHPNSFSNPQFKKWFAADP